MSVAEHLATMHELLPTLLPATADPDPNILAAVVEKVRETAARITEETKTDPIYVANPDLVTQLERTNAELGRILQSVPSFMETRRAVAATATIALALIGTLIGALGGAARVIEPPRPVPRPPRNARCFCDSGKKYKKCHGALPPRLAPKDEGDAGPKVD